MLNEIAKLIRQSRRCFALTGAGISTESGIPDFRSPGTGLWETMDPLKYATAEVLRDNPEQFWQYGFARFKNLFAAQPNSGHLALAQLEELGMLQGLITQNIDNLHFLAGSRRLYEVHGHTRSCRCTRCQAVYPFNELLRQLDGEIIPPLCSVCGKPLRPNVVLFGDAMSEDYFLALDDLSAGCDLMLVVGTSLAVYPVADLPRFAEKLVIINLQPTPLDRQAQFVVREKTGAVLSGIAAALKNPDSGG
ncbi:MAG: NAD-dependent protein deacetylase [Syntrophomonadaceae bacterium]|nr:NAD-dependent protein deacetylase [Bacillota bacterium]